MPTRPAGAAQPALAAVAAGDAGARRVGIAAARLDLAARAIEALEERHPAIGAARPDLLGRRLEGAAAVTAFDHVWSAGCSETDLLGKERQEENEAHHRGGQGDTAERKVPAGPGG